MRKKKQTKINMEWWDELLEQSNSIYKYGFNQLFLQHKKNKKYIIMSNLNGNVQQNDFCGIVKVVDEIKEGIKNGFLYFYRDVQLVGMDQNFQRIYHIKLFNDQIYLNIQRDDFVVFKNSKIKNTVGNKIRLEFLRNESRLLIGDDQIKKIQGKQYLDEVDKNRKKYYKINQQQNSLEKYFKKVKI